MRLKRHELHTLTGSYAVDAVQGAELDEFERHLNHCSSCAAEVRGLRETAARLAMAAGERPPDAMRAQVLAAAERTRQLPPLTDERPARRRTSRVRQVRRVWIPRLSVAVAAVSIALAVVFGVAQNNTKHQLNSAEARSQAISAVLAAPDAHVVSDRTSLGGTITAVVSPGERKLVMTAAGLPSLPASKVYELWIMGPSVVRPSGLFAAPQNGPSQPILAAGFHGGYQLAVTIEPAGGTLRPTTTPIVVVPLSA